MKFAARLFLASAAPFRPEMKMFTPLALALFLPVIASAESCKHSSTQPEGLLSEVRTVLPNGWSVEIWPRNKPRTMQLWIPTHHASLSTATPKPRPISPGSTVLSVDGPKSKLKKVLFVFKSMPYLTPDQYRLVKQQSEDKSRVRLQFEEKLVDIRYGHMGPHPFPPSAYAPSDEAERKLVREYTFLWMDTKPQPLPEYFCRQLAFSGHIMEMMTFTNPAVAAEVDSGRGKISKILQRYEP